MSTTYATARAAKAALHVDKPEAVADRGYFNGEEILACEQTGITVTLPKPTTSGAKSEGRSGKQDFVYLPDENVYRRPTGEILKYRFTVEEHGQKLHRYWTDACHTCPIKAQRTTGRELRITRWEHEEEVATEMSLHVLAYNWTRVSRAPAIGPRLTSIRAPAGAANADPALHEAIWRGRPETVKLLVARGAPLEAMNRRGETALSLAVRALAEQSDWTLHANPEIVAALLSLPHLFIRLALMLA